VLRVGWSPPGNTYGRGEEEDEDKDDAVPVDLRPILLVPPSTPVRRRREFLPNNSRKAIGIIVVVVIPSSAAPSSSGVVLPARIHARILSSTKFPLNGALAHWSVSMSRCLDVGLRVLFWKGRFRIPAPCPIRFVMFVVIIILFLPSTCSLSKVTNAFLNNSKF